MNVLNSPKLFQARAVLKHANILALPVTPFVVLAPTESYNYAFQPTLFPVVVNAWISNNYWQTAYKTSAGANITTPLELWTGTDGLSFMTHQEGVGGGIFIMRGGNVDINQLVYIPGLYTLYHNLQNNGIILKINTLVLALTQGHADNLLYVNITYHLFDMNSRLFVSE